MDDHDLNTEDDDLGPPEPKSLFLRIAIAIGLIATVTAAFLGP